jgi:DNA polymerase V
MRTSYYRPENQYGAARSVGPDQLINATAGPTGHEVNRSVFKPGYKCIKAKTHCHRDLPVSEVQGSLFAPPLENEKRDHLMQTMDSLNRLLSPGAVKFGALGMKPTWAMRSDYVFQHYPTHWGKIPTVKGTHFLKISRSNSNIKNEPGGYASSSLKNDYLNKFPRSQPP